MPQQQEKISVPANDQVVDVLNNKRIKTIPSSVMQAVVTLLATGSADGLEIELFIGNDNVVERSGLGAQNRFPIIPDDFVDQSLAEGGESIQLNVYNTTAGALDFFYKVGVDYQA